MILAAVNDVIFLIYSILWKTCFLFLRFILFVSYRVKGQNKLLSQILFQLEERPEIPQLAQKLLENRQKYSNCIIFHCSSAGEYEQARPLIDRLIKTPDTMVQVFFHSHSGYHYVKARADTELPHIYFSLTPITDTVWDWGWIFSVLRPTGTFFVRYEIWPGFLMTAHHYSKTALVAAAIGPKDRGLRKLYLRLLYRYFDGIYCVSQEDYERFFKDFHVHKEFLIASGDPKYDRVYERAQDSLRHPPEIPLIKALKTYLSHDLNLRILVGGSIYEQDLTIILDSYTRILDKKPWLLILVPHHINPENIELITTKCEKMGFSPSLSSLILEKNFPDKSEKCLIIVDQMGFLAEIYAVGHAAYVGGAYHSQVHNVLEPAIRGLSLAWGPRYHNSREAQFLVKHQIATLVHQSADLDNWWSSLDDSTLGQNKAKLEALLSTMLGAAERILGHYSTTKPSRFFET